MTFRSPIPSQRTPTPLRLLLLAAVLGAVGCTHPWMTVLYGMRAERIETELLMEDEDMNARAPKNIAPSESNRWVVFLYTPQEDEDAHQAFQSLDADCFLTELDRPGGPRHAAICALERIPAIPDEEED